MKAGNSLEDKTVMTTCKRANGKRHQSRRTALTQKVIVGCEGVKFYLRLESTRKTNNAQPTQSGEIEDSGERSKVVTRGTAKLLDASVGVEVTRQKWQLAIVLYWNSTRVARGANRRTSNRFDRTCTNQRKTINASHEANLLQPL